MRKTTMCLLLVLAATALPAHAHPYLADGAIEIGEERSLPWNGETDFGLVKDYDVSTRLVPDTLACLTNTSPPLARYETLRRAALYLSPRFSTPDVALSLRVQLQRRLQGRAEREGLAPRARALAQLDAGCFEALCAKDRTLSSGRDGYAQAKQALPELPEAAGEVAYVLARIAPPGRAAQVHGAAALRLAQEDTLLARNILATWQHEFATLRALRADLERIAAQTVPEPGFPQPPPVPGADPAVRHEAVFLAPAALSVREAEDEPQARVVGWVKTNPIAVRLAVGHRMIVGTRIDAGVWVGDERVPAHDTETLLGGEPLGAVDGAGYLRDLPAANEDRKVMLRARVQLFETDIQPQHMWSPTGERYRVLWERTYEVRLR